MNVPRGKAKAGSSRGKLIVAGVVVATAALLLLAVMWVRDLVNAPAQPQKKVVQEIQIIRPPPPPDTPPPPPPPPQEEEVKLDEPQPEPTPSNDPPPGEQLGLDAAGEGAGDGFGLVGRPGGRDLLASGGSAYNWYAGLLKTEILDHLSADKKVRSGAYTVSVRVWVRPDGSVERVQLSGSSGSRDRDSAIESALARMTRMSQGPPPDMPQPINLRIVSRA